MRKVLGLIAFISLMSSVCAQEIDSVKQKKLKWVSGAQIGNLYGIASEGITQKLSTSITSGIKYSRWGTSLGVGLSDYHHFIVMPVFLEGSFDLLKRPSTPYLYARGGYSIMLVDNSLNATEKSEGGFNWEVGAGYRVMFTKFGMSFQASYQYQRVLTKQMPVYYYDIYRLDMSSFVYPENSTETTRKMGRLKFTVGIVF